MSNIDERIVEMQFNNAQFERNIQTSIKSLDNLKKGLNLDESTKSLSNLDKAGKNFSLAGIASAVEAIQSKFTALGVVGITALQNITNAAISAGSRITSALTIDPVKMGFAEYETQINAIQTIMANTQGEGATLQDVNSALDELNRYADKTIYNFTEMTRNIGTFTAAGVKLDTSVAAIKGIANLAAVSGSNAQQASNAMYQLSQALAAGKVNLMDWNSVVNAGMGGKVFQDSLIETARVHGIAIDTMIQEEGSFRNTLQKGWLTSDILTETLQKFTGDLTEEQLRQMGYTEEQIAGIIKMGQTANDAATKVKTFTQLFDTLGEAMQSGWTQSWEIIVGDFEEAKDLLTNISDTLGAFINASANARNELLQGWKDLGGRTALIEALGNAFKGILSIAKPIGEAFRDIFPRTTAQQLYNITESFRQFTERLIISDDAAEKVKSVFKGLFSVLDLGIKTVTTIISIFTKLVGAIWPLSGNLLDLAANAGDFISRMNETAQSTGIFERAISTVGDAITKVRDKLDDFNISFGLVGALFSKVGSAIAGVSSAAVKGIFSLFENFDMSKFLTLIGSGALLNISGGIKGFIDSLSELTDSMNSFVGKGSSFAETVTGILDSVKGSLESWQKDIKAGTMLKIAASVGILAASLAVIASIDEGRLKNALVAITVLFAELGAALAVFEKKLSPASLKGTGSSITAMIGISVSVLILASALKKISSISWDQLEVGLTGIAAILIMLTTVAKSLSKSSGTIMKGSTSLIAMAIAVNLLASVVEKFGAMNPEQLVQGLAGVAAVLTGIIAFTKLTSGAKGLISIGLGLTAVATALMIFTGAIAIMGSMSMESLTKGLFGLGSALILLTSALALVPKNIGSKAVGLIAASTALVVLGGALKIFGSMDLNEIGTGLLAMGGALTELVVAMALMKNAKTGAIALTTVSAGLILLSVALKTLGEMSIGQVITALITLAATFGIIAVAGIALAPLTPIIIALSAALAAFGVACLAIGAGVALLAAGLTSLGVAGVATASALISAFATAIPMVLEQIGIGIVNFATAIGNGAAAIVGAVAQILIAISQAIIQAAPQIAEAVVVLIETILVTLADHAPAIIQAGFDLIVALLRGIANNIGGVVASAVDVVVAFLNAIGRETPRIVNAGFQMMITFINGLADVVRNSGPQLGSAMANLGAAMIEGLVRGIGNFAWKIGTSLMNAASSGLKKVKNFLGIHSPSRVFAGIGKFLMLGWSKGVDDNAVTVTDSITDVSKAVVNSVEGIGKQVEKAAPNLSSIISKSFSGELFDGAPVITPIVDVSAVKDGASQISTLLSGSYGYGLTSSISTMRNLAAISSNERKDDSTEPRQNGSPDVVAAVNNLGSRLDELNENISNLELVTDTGVLAGELTPKIDKNLGKISKNKERGV